MATHDGAEIDLMVLSGGKLIRVRVQVHRRAGHHTVDANRHIQGNYEIAIRLAEGAARQDRR